MAFWRLFRVFLWKNLLFLRFNWLMLSVIFAGCFGLFAVFLKTSYNLKTTPEKIYDTRNIDILKDYFPTNSDDFLYYSPTSSFLDSLMEDVRRELSISEEALKPIGNATDLRSILEENSRGNSFAIHFEQYPLNDGASNDGSVDFRFSISSTAMRISSKKRYVNDEEVSSTKDEDDYIRTGFLLLQHVIDKNYIKIRSSAESIDYDLEISSMPTIAQDELASDRVVVNGIIYSILFSVLLLATFIVPLVEEKQNGLKEFLVIATPLNFLNGVTFYFVRLILYLLFMVAALVTSYIYNALGIVPFIYVVILYVLYMLSAMSYAYLISVCFNTVLYAKVGGFLLLIIPYTLYYVKNELSTAAIYLCSTKTFMEGLATMQIFTNKYRIFDTNDLFEKITDSSYNIFTIYSLLIVQCLLYSLLYNYLACVFPGPGGLKKPYLFLFNPSFYKKKQRNQYTTSERGTDAIIIQELVKKFKTSMREINIADRLNMVIKNKQITALLGHNGVGKTTTLNMIMGVVPKDSGKIIVCSERDVSSYRHLIGFCPQHSVFMHYMTCAQHLQFFAKLRGMSPKDANSIACGLLKQLRLTEKANEYGKNLSGGMKRRLSLGIALSGDTKIVILDEPSSGLDIESRRVLWDILLDLRKTKAILVTTHHMEEAEVLGDTICILSNGRLQRTGSPLELKRKVGSGYILKLCTDSYGGNFKEHATLELIQRSVPDAKILKVLPPTVLISLPYAYKSNYNEMLLKLENEQQQLGIYSISITDTSLEDVFLNCANEVDQVDGPNGLQRNGSSRVPYHRLDTPTDINVIQQCMAIFYKKFIYLRHEWLYTLIMLSLPFICTAVAILLMNSRSLRSDEDILQINLKHIKNGIIYLHNPFEGNSNNHRIENILTKQIEQHGIQAKKLTVHSNAIDALLDLQQNDFAHFLQNVIGVIEIAGPDSGDGGGNLFKLYFSGNIYHSSVILLNLIDNAVLKLQTGEANQIHTTYVPIRRFITDVSPTRLEHYAAIVPIGMFFCMFFYVTLPFREHETSFKQLQAVPRLTYWLSTLLFDIVLHLIVCLLLYGFQYNIMPKALYSPNEQMLIVSSIFFYGCSYLPILYSFANSFRSISTITTYLLFMFIISAITPLMTSGSVQMMQYHETLIMFLSLLPDFNLNHQLRVINENFIIYRRSKVPSQFLLSTGTFFLDAIFVGIFSMMIFIGVLESKEKRQGLHNLFNCYNCRQVRPNRPILSEEEEEESFVKREQKTVDEILKDKKESDYPLLVNNLYKFYDRRAVVCGINFVVRKQECFGLLGVNGAGKTTTFQMITANRTITGGTIKIDGVDILQQETQYRYRFGYCPQHDCLNHFMTSYQILKYMAQLRGIATKNIHNEVMFWLEELDLLKYQNIAIQHYSGGTKRKLNAAIAMIGSPSLVLLDEPTTGVDPVSRRFLWKCIQDFQKRDKTIVLTSHSMDECEQLCNRLAIMADGRFKCLGAVPDLKQLYGAGFTIKVKMKVDDTAENVDYITTQMCSQFRHSELRENHAGMLTYFIKNVHHIQWSNVFKRTELFLRDCIDLVEDYSVNESSLEDIFLKFDSGKNGNSQQEQQQQQDLLQSHETLEVV